jgi:hypothetical protein
MALLLEATTGLRGRVLSKMAKMQSAGGVKILPVPDRIFFNDYNPKVGGAIATANYESASDDKSRQLITEKAIFNAQLEGLDLALQKAYPPKDNSGQTPISLSDPIDWLKVSPEDKSTYRNYWLFFGHRIINLD